MGVTTVADLAGLPRSSLQREFGLRAGSLLFDLAWGIDSSRVVARPGERGVGNQETFGRDLSDPASVQAELLRIAVKVTSRMRAA
jgi:DNA polymerase-4